ncbi:MAG: hypothetical protein HC860_13970 [Alkalinema sp. RU_4_3]|nr:hypothetical protein [Alkalinema sp. RU_4_3]
MVLRLAFLGGLVALLVALTVQNMTPITLVVLGSPARSLPLSFWLLVALLLGSMTSIGLAVLLQTAGLLGRHEERRSKRSPNQKRRFGFKWPKFSMPSTSGRSNRGAEWDDEPWDSQEVDQPRPAPQREVRDPRREKVVDAEFRVITPPSRKLEED